MDPINSYRENGELKYNIPSYLCEYCPTMAMSNGANFQVKLLVNGMMLLEISICYLPDL